MSKKKAIWGTVLVVSVIGLGGISILQANKSLSVTTVKVTEGSLAEKVFASGNLEATTTNHYYAPAAGVIDTLNVKVGDKVSKGQTLFTMKTDDLEDNLQIEKNKLKIAQAQLDDAKKQNDEPSGNPLVPKQKIDTDTLELDVQNEQLAVNALQKKLDASKIVATGDGVVTDLPFTAGQMATEGTPILTVTNLGNLQVRAAVSELDSNKVKAGLPAKVTGDGFQDTYDGKVTYISPVAMPANQQSKDISVEMLVALNKTSAELRPGYNAAVEIDLPADKHLLAPLSAVKHDGDNAYVFEIDDQGKAKRVDVKTGHEDDDNIEILSGLKANDQIITDVPDTLTDGKKVKAK